MVQGKVPEVLVGCGRSDAKDSMAVRSVEAPSHDASMGHALTSSSPASSQPIAIARGVAACVSFMASIATFASCGTATVAASVTSSSSVVLSVVDVFSCGDGGGAALAAAT